MNCLACARRSRKGVRVEGHPAVPTLYSPLGTLFVEVRTVRLSA